MTRPQVVYYGPRDVASSVFQQYLHMLGYASDLVSNPARLFDAVFEHRAAILVLAMPDSPERLIDLAGQLRECAGGPHYPIFILSHEMLDTEVPDVEVIWHPNALRQLANRITKLGPRLED